LAHTYNFRTWDTEAGRKGGGGGNRRGSGVSPLAMDSNFKKANMTSKAQQRRVSHKPKLTGEQKISLMLNWNRKY
jgi:hypothetical protein